MLKNIPLLIVPFILYNLVLAGAIEAGTGPEDPFAQEIFAVGMMSGGRWTMSLGDLLIVAGLLILFFEIMKSTRTNNASVLDHLLSTLVFVAYLIEFLLVADAAHPVFFILMVITLVDVLAGFSVTIRAAGRDVSLY